MWRLHHGSLAWVTKLQQFPELVKCAEFDVEDCFLNTPRDLVMQALDFWMGFSLVQNAAAALVFDRTLLSPLLGDQLHSDSGFGGVVNEQQFDVQSGG